MEIGFNPGSTFFIGHKLGSVYKPIVYKQNKEYLRPGVDGVQ